MASLSPAQGHSTQQIQMEMGLVGTRLQPQQKTAPLKQQLSIEKKDRPSPQQHKSPVEADPSPWLSSTHTPPISHSPAAVRGRPPPLGKFPGPGTDLSGISPPSQIQPRCASVPKAHHVHPSPQWITNHSPPAHQPPSLSLRLAGDRRG